MIKFNTLSIRNFMSYGNVPTIVDFNVPGSTLISGENLDVTGSGTGSNGVGKTTIINALSYAVYDTTLTKRSLDNLVNNVNKKNLEVILDFEKDGVFYRIRRVRKEKGGKGGNYVELFIDGEDKTPDSVANANKAIEEIMGLPHELFVRIITFSANHTPFLDMPVRHATLPNQTDFIEELFNFKRLTEKANVLKKAITGSENSLETQLSRVDQLKKEHERHKKLLETAQNRVTNWEHQHRSDIANVEARLASLQEVNIAQHEKLFTAIEEVQTVILAEKAKADNFSIDIRAKTSEKMAIEKQLSSNQTQIKALTSAIKRNTAEIKQLEENKCPTCLQRFTSTQDEIEKRKTEIQTAQEQIETFLEENDKIVSKIGEFNDAIAKITAEQLEIITSIKKDEQEKKTLTSLLKVKTRNELNAINDSIIRATQDLASHKEATNPFVEPLEELERVKLDSIDMEPINKLTKYIEHQKFLLKLLTKKDSFIRKPLLNKNIPLLNEKLAGYLKDLGLPHTVKFSLEMTADISEFGRPLDFEGLSNGQRARVNLALSLAFRDVLQSLHTSINVCMLDEVLDVGLDAIGVTSAARILKHKARQEGLCMFIISHRDEVDGIFDRKMTIQWSKGFSSLKLE